MARSEHSPTLPSPPERLAGVVGRRPAPSGLPVLLGPPVLPGRAGAPGPPGASGVGEAGVGEAGTPGDRRPDPAPTWAGRGSAPTVFGATRSVPIGPGPQPYGVASPESGSPPWMRSDGSMLVDDVGGWAGSGAPEGRVSSAVVGAGRVTDDGVDGRSAPQFPSTGLGRLRGGLERALAAWIPASWRTARVDPGRPAATALALVAAAAAVVAAFGVWTERPQAVPVSGLPSVSVSGSPTDAGPSPVLSAPVRSAPAAASPGPSPAPAGPLVISVSGRVRRPGLVHVPDGARVADVLDAAGGALPGTDLTTLNLARRVGDGEQVAVGVPAAPDAGGAAGTGSGLSVAGPAPTGPLDLNAATIEQFDALPGVGPVTAQRIVDWRTHNGHFARVDQLREVPGIGEQKFAQLRDLVRV